MKGVLLRVRVETLGCRLNTSEIQRIGRQFVTDGHRVVGPDGPADVCILNTCAVTHIAARKSRQLMRHLKQAHPGATMVVTGCYAELEGEQVAALGADIVVGNQEKDDIVKLVAQHLGTRPIRHQTQVVQEPDNQRLHPGPRTRAFVKVQDGCDNRCTYCVVTIARGPARSRLADEIVAEVQHLEAIGYREVVLSGVHLGSYGHDLGHRHGIFHLTRRLLDETGIRRLRLSSLEPWDLAVDFFSLWENSRLGRHLHLPLQSGCDATLRRMARRTTTEKFARLVSAARAAIPGLSVTTDLMVAFPGETDDEFIESLDFVEAMAFAKIHVFRYSARPATAAASMADQVPPEMAAARSQRAHQVGARMERSFRHRFLGRTMDVLWENAEPTGANLLWSGLTDNYLRVSASEGPHLRNTITPVRLVAHTPTGLRGQILVRDQTPLLIPEPALSQL